MRWLDPASSKGAVRPVRDQRVMAYVGSASAHIANVRTTMRVLDGGTHCWPVSVNDGLDPPGNCYVVSPRGAYSEYAQVEIRRLNRPWMTWPLSVAAKGLGSWFSRAGLDRVVHVNNWLLSTNVYPSDWDGADLPEMLRFLREQYPDHAIAFRSLNDVASAAPIASMRKLGLLAVPSRQVYQFDGRAGQASTFLRHHNTRLDAALWRHTPYRVEDGARLSEGELQRVVALYGQLYLHKYSTLNPQYGPDWMACGQRDGWLELRVLRHPQGRIDGVVGWWGDADWLTAPIVGYDTSLPASAGLYRLITGLCLQETVRRRCRLNFSSGAAHFKRLRGGVPAIEYSMVEVSHLSAPRQRVWRALQGVLQRVAVPLMQRWEL